MLPHNLYPTIALEADTTAFDAGQITDIQNGWAMLITAFIMVVVIILYRIFKPIIVDFQNKMDNEEFKDN